MTSVITGLVLASGCKNASVNNGPSPVPGGVGSPSIYRSYPQPAAPYSDNMNQLPSSQPAPPAPLPAPGYTEPEVPPAPTTQKSRWNFLPSNFKLPTFSRPTNDVHQTAAKSDDHGITSIFRKSKPVTPTLRDESDDEEMIEEVVHSRSSVTSDAMDSETPNVGNVNVPQLTGPATLGKTIDSSDETPRLLPSNK